MRFHWLSHYLRPLGLDNWWGHLFVIVFCVGLLYLVLKSLAMTLRRH